MQRTATELALRLATHPAVSRVHHPSLATTDPELLVGRQMSGLGSMIAFELHGGFAAARTLLGSLTLLTHAVSLGSTDTLIQHPASLTHRVVDEACRAQSGVNDSLLRISVGLEHVEDLWTDLAMALDLVTEQDKHHGIFKSGASQLALAVSTPVSPSQTSTSAPPLIFKSFPGPALR